MGCVRSKPKSSHSCRSCGLRKFPSLTHVPKISFQETSINPSRDIFSVAHKMSFLGTIHILRKHSYSTKLNLTTLFFTNTVFFRQNKTISFSILHFDEISCWSLKFLVHKKETNCSKNSWKCCGWSNKCLRNIWMVPKLWSSWIPRCGSTNFYRAIGGLSDVLSPYCHFIFIRWL